MIVDQPIRLAPYDPAWPDRAAAEIAILERALAPWLAGAVEHVGSTAVPGLEAKPTIDLMAPVANRPHHHWFCKPSPAVRDFHLILIEPTHPDHAARLRFRDRLRADPATAAAYVALKRDLAARHPDDREAYTDGKADFVARACA
jgi:GrpB-like predicted nucleotidyltransferase (UPF0157 family)